MKLAFWTAGTGVRAAGSAVAGTFTSVAGNLRGAATDVFATEPPPIDHPLLSLPNFLPLPHLGASTAEAQRRAGTDAAALLIEALAAGK